MRSLCGQIGPGDGLDPRLETKGNRPGSAGRKARQLCAQAAEALAFALAATADDDRIAALTVASVVPGPDASRLIATLVPPPGEPFDPAELIASLDRSSARLRAEVARAITRRKAPALAFRIVVA